MAESKVYFVATCKEERRVFTELLPEGVPVFVNRLAQVPEDASLVSVMFDSPIDEKFLDAHPSLVLLATRSTTCDHIDLEACRERSIAVKNVADYGENTVAEHVFALLLALSRKLRTCYDSVRLGRLDRSELRGFDLFGKTLGVIGCGRVGLHVIRLAAGFRMKVLGHDTHPHPFHTELLDFEYCSLARIFAESDVITLHIPLTSKTRHMIDSKAVQQFKPGVVLINTARGGLLEMQAVMDGLESAQIGGLGLDVLEDESVFRGGASNILGAQIAERVRVAGDAQGRGTRLRLEEIRNVMRTHRVLQHPQVVFTPHTAYNSIEAVERICRLTVSNLRPFLPGTNPQKDS